MDEPAHFDWIQKSNVARHVCEYLTIYGSDNVARPYLAESWSASNDLKSWTFKLRRDIKWHNGDEFNADDVIFNMTRWLDPAMGSSNVGRFPAMVAPSGRKTEDGADILEMIPGAIEKLDSHTVRFNCNKPFLTMPESFADYPTLIVHRDFKGDFHKNPNGTGPYQLTEFAIGQKAILKRAPGQYWGERITDNPFFGGPIYLDEIHYYDHGAMSSPAPLAAFNSGQVDTTYSVDFVSLPQAEQVRNATVHHADTAQTFVLRMRTSEKPFDNKKLRQAVLACVDVPAYSAQVYNGKAVHGEHHHVAPFHPEYFALPKLKQDYARAKKLLAEAGYPNGVELTITIGNTEGQVETHTGEILKQQLAPAGITLNLNVQPAAKYWETWKTAPFGLTAWTHRPLGVQCLSLAYRSGVDWNEADYNNPEFDKALDEAESLADAKKRSRAMKKVLQILQDDAIMVQPMWRPIYVPAHNRVQNFQVHPTLFHQFHKVWLKS